MVNRQQSPVHENRFDMTNDETDTEVYDLERISLDNFLDTFSNFELLSELIKEYKYTPSIKNLETVLLNDKYIADTSIRTSILLESAVIIFHTTKSGISILNSLYKLSYSNGSKIPLLTSLSKFKNWTKKNSTTNYNYKYMRECWKDNQQEYLLRFLKFLILNRENPIDATLYNKKLHKISLSSLFNSKSNMASLVLDEDYNLLIDFIIFFQPLIDTLLVLALRSYLLKLIVANYKRTYEFNYSYIWFKFKNENTHDNISMNLTYLSQIPSLQNIRDGISDKVDVNNNNSTIQKDTSTNQTNFDKWLKDLSFDNEDVLEINSSIMHQQISSEEHVFSFNLNQSRNNLELPNLIAHTESRHKILYHILKLDTLNSPFLKVQFKVIAGLVDPLTQPLPNDSNVISLDLIYQMFIGLIGGHFGVKTLSNEEGFDWKFMVCFNMQKIINQSLMRLNCEDYDRLASINNNSEQHWKNDLDKWLPQTLNTQDLELVYMIDILAVYTIYSLYSHLPTQMNPFLTSLIQLWKNLSCVILHGLEIDRLEEAHETFETPLLVRATIRGASALRAVVATILNQHVQENQHDFKHEALNTFMSPYGRKLCQGTLLADLRTHAAAMLAMGSDLQDITELLADLQAGDRFDEDVRYMFDYEYDDYNDTEEVDEYELKQNASSGEPELVDGRRRRCNCIFEDDKVLQNDEYKVMNHNTHDLMNGELLPEAIKSKPSEYPNVSDGQFASRVKSLFEFDRSGKDWRDTPRGFNLYFSPTYHFIQSPRLDDVYKLILKATTEKLNMKDSMRLLESVASCVKIEQENMVLQNVGTKEISKPESTDESQPKLITPDDIYEILCEESAFERMLYENQELSWRLVDEMLMCSGYRRVLIWFITHMEISHCLIHYIFELAMGLRGQKISTKLSEQEKKNVLLSDLMVDDETVEGDNSIFKFSRQGNILLSDIENKMLLQEFFTSAAIYLATNGGHDSSILDATHDRSVSNPVKEGDNVSLYSIGLIKLICYMVQTLLNNKKFDFGKSECTFELQTLLMNWIGIIPEARDLFFTLKSQVGSSSAEEDASNIEKETETLNYLNGKDANETISVFHDIREDDDKEEEPISEYNKMLLKLMPRRVDVTENVALRTLQTFLQKYSFTRKVPIIGRRIIHYEDKILPLADIDKPLGISVVLGYDNDLVHGSDNEDLIF